MARAASVDNHDAAGDPLAAIGDIVDSVIAASQVLVGIATRSVSSVNNDVTLSQYRTLVLLVSRGPQRIADVAELLDVEPSTATRMSNRLVRKGLIERLNTADDRRVVQLTVTDSGRDLVAAVTRKRRAEVRSILKKLPKHSLGSLIDSLREFTDASGESVAAVRTHGWVP